MFIIVLAGMPAAGKSTAAKALRSAFHLPVLEKDALKEAIFDTMGFSCYAEKRKIDHAANAALLRCAQALLENGQSMILDNNFDAASAQMLNELIHKYDCRCVTVFFGGDPDVFFRRYVDRDRRKERHLGHALQEHYPPWPGDALEHDMTREEFREKFESRGMMQFRVDGQRIDLDATEPGRIDMNALMEQIRSLIFQAKEEE